MATLTTFLKLLKPEKNDYVDVEKHISENYDKIDTEFLKIDTKFKNYPVPVGGILMMYNTSNPAELYSGTTWELLASDKYLKTTTGTPLQTGGSNSFTIAKTNLPSTKLQIESFSLTRGTMNITGSHGGHAFKTGSPTSSAQGCFVGSSEGLGGAGQDGNVGVYRTYFDASRSWTGSTSSASPYTVQMGSGTPISINPEYITIRAWKRLS